MKTDLIAIIFLTISIILILIIPESKLGVAILIAGALLLLYSLIKEKIIKNKK